MADDFISRKAAMEYLYRSINADQNGNCPDCIHDEHDCQYDRCWTLMDFCEKIEYIGYVPAADVAPVRHGRWILKSTHEGLGDDPEQYWECSLCGCGSDSFDTVYHTPYCPECGAKMNKEEG